MKRTGLAMSLLVITNGCATLYLGDRASMPDAPLVRKDVASLVQKMDFSTARDRAQREKNKGEWCEFFNKENRCYTRSSENEADQLLEQILNAETCHNAVKEGSKPQATRQAAERIAQTIEVSCQKKGIPDAWSPQIQKTNLTLEKSRDDLPHEGKSPTGTINPLADAQNRCQAAMHWGYSRRNSWVLRREDLQGKFPTFDACEEARLQDPANPEHRCVRRNTGGPQHATITVATIMAHNVLHQNTKLSAYFSDTSSCASALKAGGHAPLEKDGVALSIAPVGTSDVPRFIGECRSEQVAVCQALGEEIKSIHLANQD